MKIPSKIWNTKNRKEESMPESIKKFLIDIIKVCKKHKLSISHQDWQGGFQIEEYKEYNINWLLQASDSIDESFYH